MDNLPHAAIKDAEENYIIDATHIGVKRGIF